MIHTQIFLEGEARPSAAVRHSNGKTVSIGCRWDVSNALTIFGTLTEVRGFVNVLIQQMNTLEEEQEVINALPY